MTLSNNLRKQPSSKYQDEQLDRQRKRCFYCGLEFFEYVKNERTNKIIKLLVVWDHFIPYSWNEDNKDINFVASCQICNGIKSNKMFDTDDAARKYIIEKRKAKGYTGYERVSKLFGTIFYEEEDKGLL